MRTLILSLSRCGSTVLFYHILAAMPKPYKTYFEPKSYDQLLYDATPNLLVKMILESVPLSDIGALSALFDRQILIIRDPRDRIVSSMLFSMHGVDSILLEQRLELLEQKCKCPAKMDFIDLVIKMYPNLTRQSIADYVSEALNRFQEATSLLHNYYLLRYENYVQYGWGGLEEYLNRQNPVNFELPERHQYGKRRVAPGDWKNWFTPRDIEFFQPILDRFLQKYDYSQDWTPSAQPLILAEHSTAFVQNAYMQNRRYLKTGISWQE